MGKYSVDEEYFADEMIRWYVWEIIAILLLVIVVACYRCSYGPAIREDQMFNAAETVHQAIITYHIEHDQWPESLEQLREYPNLGIKWPENPFNHKPLADTGSPNFQKHTSVGMVHYLPIFKDSVQVGFDLYVFGQKDLLTIMHEE